MNNPGRQALLGLVAGALVLVVLTALLTSAFSSSQTVGQTRDLASQMQQTLDEMKALRDEQAESNRASDQRSKKASNERDLAYEQIRQLRRQVTMSNRTAALLVRLLRANGIDVPPTVTTPRSGENRPKAPRPTSPGSPTPTGRGPRNPSSDPLLTCQLVPALCVPLSIPTTLP